MLPSPSWTLRNTTQASRVPLTRLPRLPSASQRPVSKLWARPLPFLKSCPSQHSITSSVAQRSPNLGPSAGRYASLTLPCLIVQSLQNVASHRRLQHVSTTAARQYYPDTALQSIGARHGSSAQMLKRERTWRACAAAGHVGDTLRIHDIEFNKVFQVSSMLRRRRSVKCKDSYGP
jgi:hypothetical protein